MPLRLLGLLHRCHLIVQQTPISRSDDQCLAARASPTAVNSKAVALSPILFGIDDEDARRADKNVVDIGVGGGGCVGREEGTDVDSVDPCQLNSRQRQFEVLTWEGTTCKGMKDPLPHCHHQQRLASQFGLSWVVTPRRGTQ